MTRNYWLKDKIVAKGYSFWTFEILDGRKEKMVQETIVTIDESPSLKVIEKCEIEEDGKKVWKPVLVVWEKLETIYTDKKFLENHNHIRLLEANGDAVGILRKYDNHGEHVESWVLHGLKIEDISFGDNNLKADFTFHHALYLSD